MMEEAIKYDVKVNNIRDLNKLGCSAGCIFAHKWEGLSPNGGCSCLDGLNPPEKLILRKKILALKEFAIRQEKVASDLHWALYPDNMGR